MRRPLLLALLGLGAMMFGAAFLVVGTLVPDRALDLPDCAKGVADTTCLETVPGSFEVQPGVNRRVLLAFRADDGRSSSRSVSSSDIENLDRWVSGVLHGGSLVAAETGGGERTWFGPPWFRTWRVLAVTGLVGGALLLAAAWWSSRRRPGGPPPRLPPA
ncbi:hypothetical protein EKO23_14955 [Nocardioides guangzhouensis]|uniref:Uncharacterized protein n=1 Tax=Nocardioides guangzhouensis TaxID=2497878 RepID=A0A4Q4ZB82_9ACTN|nr:hypothetical protein [Nocardioides guangzhouensis]RYP84805.1 hypothetical protein EKO23_14955 [Nocardioides guangzhouensis]